MDCLYHPSEGQLKQSDSRTLGFPNTRGGEGECFVLDTRLGRGINLINSLSADVPHFSNGSAIGLHVWMWVKTLLAIFSSTGLVVALFLAVSYSHR